MELLTPPCVDQLHLHSPMTDTSVPLSNVQNRGNSARATSWYVSSMCLRSEGIVDSIA
jgi:hypothetical protein